MRTRALFTFAIAILVLWVISSCVAPVNSGFESARMLDKGDVEFTGSFASYIYAEDGESETINNNLGLRVGYGFSEKFNLSLRYIRLIRSGDLDGGVNYMALAPKVSFIQDKLAFTIPTGLYFYGEGGENGSEFFTSPKLMFTVAPSNKFEATIGGKADFFFFEEDTEIYPGFNLGFGVSTDLDTWAVRPEVGYLFDPGESGHAWNFGIGISYTMNRK